MNKPKTERFIDVDITSLSLKGHGRGTHPNPHDEELPDWTVDVPFAIPGDRMHAKVYAKRSGIHQCRLEEIITPSPDRIEPRCIHFGSCGGCRWQQMPYEKQLRYKEGIVRRAFSGVLTSAIPLYSIVPSPSPWNYRNKMEFSFSSDKSGTKYLGLNIENGKGKVINLTECHLVNPWQIDTLKNVRTWWEHSNLEAYRPYRNTGSLRTLILREGMRTGDRLVMLTVSGNPDYALHKNQIAHFVEAVTQCATPASQATLSIFVRIQQIAKGKPTMFYEMHLAGPDTMQEELHIQSNADTPPDALKFKISPTAFFQPNTLQAEQLYSLVLQHADIPNDAVLYDLYCGTGTLGISIAKHVKQVISVELSPEAVLDARANAALNGVDNVTVIQGSVGEVLKNPPGGIPLPTPDVVLIDPPRAGLEPEAIRHLLMLKPAKIAYVSCNPTTQAANIVELIHGGYQLDLLQPVDQFPHTVHIENIAILTLEAT